MKFCFYYSIKKGPPKHLNDLAIQTFKKPKIQHLNNTVFITENDDINRSYFNKGNKFGYLSGYIRDYTLPKTSVLNEHNQSLFLELSKSHWPLTNNFTGSFSAITFDETKKQMIIANDSIGIYPVYYYHNNEEIAISSSIILLACIINEEFDPVGVIQSIVGPDYCNYGNRTLIKNVYRLLPGELLEFSLDSLSIKNQKFDTLLYQQIKENDTKSAAIEIYKTSLKEHEIATRFDNSINLALSGGLDSRVILSSIPEGKEINCHTYGDSEYYETKIAKRCSKLKKNSRFFNYPILSDILYPNLKKLSESVLYTEAVGQNEWFSIFDNINENKSLLIYGEMTEAIMGRNLGGMKELGINDFIKLIFNRPFKLKDSIEDDFNEWKNNKLNVIIDGLFNNKDKYRPFFDVEKFAKQNGFNVCREEIIKSYKKDLNQLFDIIEKHGLKNKQVYNELFSWLTHGRISMSRQILLGNNKFYCISPTMSIGMLRSVSQIHPEIRIYSKLINGFFKYNKSIKKYKSIPTAATPFIPQSSQLIISFIVRGLRSKIDKWLTKRIIKRKEPTLRYRVLKSFNLPKSYSENSYDLSVKEWFKPNHLGDVAKQCNNLVTKRQTGESWPLNSFDITSIASINIQIDLIKKFKSTNS